MNYSTDVSSKYGFLIEFSELIYIHSCLQVKQLLWVPERYRKYAIGPSWCSAEYSTCQSS